MTNTACRKCIWEDNCLYKTNNCEYFDPVLDYEGMKQTTYDRDEYECEWQQYLYYWQNEEWE